MTPAQLRLLADLILPGDREGLPPGSLVPDVMSALVQSASPVKALAGAHPDFADAGRRHGLLEEIERAHPQAFRDFALALIKAYYESGQVLEAMGWRSAPPQPDGHRLAPMDEALAPALARVAGRKRLWR
ncbi:MAG: hypothetical protein AB7S92_05275 [Parvibaculaceae bacterium]